MTANRRRVLIALMGAQVLAGLAHGVTYSMGALLSAEMAGAAWGGAASTVTTVGAGLWAVPLATLVEKRGRRASLSTGLALGSLGALSALAGAQTNLFAFVLIGFFFLGAAVAMNLQARFAAADVAGEDNQGRFISLVVWSTTVGAVAGPNLFAPTEKLGEALGLAPFSGAYLVCFGVQWLAVVLLQVMIRPEVHPTRTRATGRVPLGRYPSAAAAIAVNAVSHFAMVALMSMTAVHLHGHGASITLIGVTISFHVLGMYGFAPVFGWLADATRPSLAIHLGLGLSLLSASMMIAGAQTEAVVVVALLLLGVGWSSTLVGSSTLITNVTAEQDRPTVQGRSDFVMNLTGATGGVIAGPVVSMWGIEWMGVVVVAAIAVVVAGTRVYGARAAAPKK
ncbi:MFS transporter [Corynebacterium guangdongense]|uniref:MFS family permease n=1 Tax=Corynebacterium guangdongense TaxID=1783348 RepID=A0ABU1ZTS9_9CORY|nr:MFS transporter [Corynebacterium guangdongense]MDR7328335.1 MFS family permease [Corynebacterium guangdongense]WJZ16913.1 Major Facilitator Superfamily protein [Corynebacterium guangdongense]